MKLLLTGATGAIGSYVLNQCISDPRVTSVVVFVRRPLTADVASIAKVHVVLLSDFGSWPEDLLREHKDARAMIWCLGDWEGRREVAIEFPLAFQNAFIAMRSSTIDSTGLFTYVHLSGKLTEQNQSKSLWFLEDIRKLKGLHEIAAIELAEKHKSWWCLKIVRPGGVLQSRGCMAAIQELTLGTTWFVQGKELSTYMVYLALGGVEDQMIVLNTRIVEKGRELLAENARKTQ